MQTSKASCFFDCYFLTLEQKLKMGRGERGRKRIEVGVPEWEAGAEAIKSSSSRTPFLNRGPETWWWKREVGDPVLLTHRLRVCLTESLSHQHNSVSPTHTGGYESERDAPSMGPSPIINIKKEKRETEEETKEILRKLERDNVSLLVFTRLCLRN